MKLSTTTQFVLCVNLECGQIKFNYQPFMNINDLFTVGQAMKQQRVKLMNQMKDDAEQFRKMKAEMAKEVLQLKSQV